MKSRMERTYRIFSLRTNRARSPRTGEDHDFQIIEAPDWVNVIPLTVSKEVVMIRQYRHGIDSVTLEIPGGMLEPSDSPESAARRELLEETGYGAHSMRSLGFVHPNPAIQNNRCFTFLALNAAPEGPQRLDGKEDIEVVLAPLNRIAALIADGTIAHSLVIAAFYRYFMEFRSNASR